MAVNEWIRHSTGIRYYEHETRRRSKDSKFKDRMWGFQFKFEGKVHVCNLGWESEGMTEDVVLGLWTKYARNRTLRTPPYTPKEDMEMARTAKEEAAKAQEIQTARLIDNLFEAMLEDKKTTAGVAADYEAEAKRRYEIWAKFHIGRIDIAKLEKKDLIPILEDLRAGTPSDPEQAKRVAYMKGKPRSPQMQEHVLNVISTIWKFAAANKLVAGDWPGSEIKIVYDNKRHFFFTADQAKAVLADLRQSGSLKGSTNCTGSLDAWGMALFSLHCGLRAGEILSMTWSDADQCRIYETKNKKKSRMFYPTDEVKAMLAERRELSPYTKPTDYVFPREDGGKLSQASRIFARCFLRLKINEKGEEDPAKKACFHSFRHTFATVHAMRGTNMHTLAGLLGHSVQKTTERYAHFSPDAAAQAINNIGGFGI